MTLALSRAEPHIEQLDEWCIDALGRSRPPLVRSAATRPSCLQWRRSVVLLVRFKVSITSNEDRRRTIALPSITIASIPPLCWTRNCLRQRTLRIASSSCWPTIKVRISAPRPFSGSSARGGLDLVLGMVHPFLVPVRLNSYAAEPIAAVCDPRR